MKKTGPGWIELTLLFATFIAATYGFGMYLFPALVEAIRVDIAFEYSTLGNITGMVQAGFLFCALLSGILTVRFGALNVILASIILCATCLGGLYFSENAVQLACLLAVLGGCAASIWVPMVDVSQKLIPARHRGKALGLMSSGTGYGIFINSIFISSFLASEGWRFILAITFGIVSILAVIALCRLWPQRQAYTHQERVYDQDTDKPKMSGRWLERIRQLPKSITITILLMMFLNGISCMPFQNYLSAYLLGELNYGSEVSSGAWRIMGLVGMVSGFAIGALADRITIKWAMVLTHLLLSAATIFMLFSARDAGFAYVAAFFFGLAFYAIYGLVPAYISHVFSKGSATMVFAMGNLALGIGGIVGNTLGGHLKTLLGSFDYIYTVVLCAAIMSVLLSLIMPREPQHLVTTGGLSNG